MNNVFKAVKITDKVYWVGAVDWAIRDFHGYFTSRGTTYNAYLVMADKVTLIDAVKRPFMDEMLSRIASVVAPEKIDYIVSNHSELDHSGCLPEVVHRCRPERVVASPLGIQCLKDHFNEDLGVTPVKEGERLSLGNRTLSFLSTPMLHWPESMFTLLEEEGILFSQDAFGMHLASSSIFADEEEESILRYEAVKYFANILLPYAPRIQKLMEKTAGLVEGIHIIAPDHGPIWRTNARFIIDNYHEWADQRPGHKAVVLYETMWNSTASMAYAVAQGLGAFGAQVKLMPLRVTHRSDVVTQIFDAGAILIGSPTLNNNLYPSVADILCYLKGLRPRNKVGAAFGSYGWSGEAVKLINEELDDMHVEKVDEGVRIRYVPDDEGLARCVELGRTVAKRLREKIESRLVHEEAKE